MLFVDTFVKLNNFSLGVAVSSYVRRIGGSRNSPSKAPGNIRCAALTSQSLQVSWLPPPSEYCHGILEGYKISFEPVTENGDTKIYIKKTSALTTVLTGLKKFTDYNIQVLAFTKTGEGVSSTPTICQTAEDVPGFPADVKVAVSSSQSLRLSWLPPLEPNGVLMKYHIYKRTMDGRQEIEHSKETVSIQHTSYEIKGVQVNVEYQLWVTCSTKIGEGQSSKVVTQIATSQGKVE